MAISSFAKWIQFPTDSPVGSVTDHRWIFFPCHNDLFGHMVGLYFLSFFFSPFITDVLPKMAFNFLFYFFWAFLGEDDFREKEDRFEHRECVCGRVISPRPILLDGLDIMHYQNTFGRSGCALVHGANSRICRGIWWCRNNFPFATADRDEIQDLLLDEWKHSNHNYWIRINNQKIVLKSQKSLLLWMLETWVSQTLTAIPSPNRRKNSAGVQLSVSQMR